MVLLHYEHISIVCLSEHKATRKYRKNLPKTLPKWGPNPLKIDAKNVLFFNIDFLGFRPRFWSLLGLQVGAKLASGRSNSELEPPPWSILTWTSLQNCDWRAPGLDFKGPGLDFGSLRPRFQLVLGAIFPDFWFFQGSFIELAGSPTQCQESQSLAKV